MSKKFAIISLIIVALLGSALTFYASNLFFSDVANFGAGFANVTLFATLPAMLLGAIFIAAPLYIIRFYKRANSRKVLTRNYLLIAIALAAFGMIFAILAGIINYRGNFVSYPFPGYLIIMIVLDVLIIVGSAVCLLKFVPKMADDTEKFKVNFLHVLHTIGLYLLIALAFNRFGAFLLMPVYAQFSTLYKTFVYYLFLLIPMGLLVIKTLKILEIGKGYFIPLLIVGILNIGLFASIVVLGMNDSAFISAVSAAAPLERLGSMPMEIMIHFVVYLGVSIYYIIK
jgi:MFS family permease